MMRERARLRGERQHALEIARPGRLAQADRGMGYPMVLELVERGLVARPDQRAIHRLTGFERQARFEAPAMIGGQHLEPLQLDARPGAAGLRRCSA